MNKTYRHPLTGETYTEGSRYVTRLPDGTIWDGVPTEAEIEGFGFIRCFDKPVSEPLEDRFNPYRDRMKAIKAELQDMEYLTSKALDGEDMTKYGDWQARRRALRAEYNALEAAGRQLQANSQTQKQ